MMRRWIAVLAVALTAGCGAGAEPAQDRSDQPRRGFEAEAEERVDRTVYTAVINQEEQYSIWPADRDLPLGWEKAGKEGSKDEVIAYIEEVWTDTRPRSLREKMEREALRTEAGAAPSQ